eukprot:scaffold1903_cov396-Prasinococcus_capsulatus_cf.AAC.34
MEILRSYLSRPGRWHCGKDIRRAGGPGRGAGGVRHRGRHDQGATYYLSPLDTPGATWRPPQLGSHAVGPIELRRMRHFPARRRRRWQAERC